MNERKWIRRSKWLTDNGAITDEQLVELRGERSEKAAECCNEATQNRGEAEEAEMERRFHPEGIPRADFI